MIEEGPGPGTGAGGGPGAGPGGDSAIESLTAQGVDGARDAFTEFRTDRRGGLVRLEQVVWSLMDALQRATREILPLAPLKTHDDYTFVHSVNVSLLTLAQARSFGIEGARLHAIGLAAFLHDIGKLKIPLEVLNKPGKLEGDEWRIMMGHAQEGATHLCGVEGSHPLAILVAYEHHMRYDGQPNYPVPRIGRRPTLASQMTSISDVYDAICTTRPYAKARSREFAVKRAHRARGHLPQPRAGGELRPHGRRRGHADHLVDSVVLVGLAGPVGPRLRAVGRVEIPGRLRVELALALLRAEVERLPLVLGLRLRRGRVDFHLAYRIETHGWSSSPLATGKADATKKGREILNGLAARSAVSDRPPEGTTR